MPKDHYNKKCYYFGCKNNDMNCSLAFFSFPTKNRSGYEKLYPGEVPQYVEWLKRCNAPKELYDTPLEKLKNKTICAKHFRKEDFANSHRRYLNTHVVPIHYSESDAVNSIGRTSAEIKKESSAEEVESKIISADTYYLSSSISIENPLKAEILDIPDAAEGENMLNDTSIGRTSAEIKTESSTAEVEKNKILSPDIYHLSSSSSIEDPFKADVLEVQSREHANTPTKQLVHKTEDIARQPAVKKHCGSKRCYYFGCKNNTKNCSLAFFSFPIKSRGEYERLHPGVPQHVEWLLRCNAPKEYYNLPLEKLRNRTICAKHFRREDFVNSHRKKLNPHAVPIHYREADSAERENMLANASNSKTSAEIKNKESLTEVRNKNLSPDIYASSSTSIKDPPKANILFLRFREPANAPTKPVENNDESEFILGL